MTFRLMGYTTEDSRPISDNGNGAARNSNDPVWTFRGYQMRPAEFNAAMVHLYRAEIQRANTWRNRLDSTTNWAVLSTGAALSFALSDPGHHHGVIILNTFLVLLFLWIEARRYRYYELWSLRTRLMETDFFAAMLAPPFAPSPEWAEQLSESLLHPEFPISVWEAFGRRFRRNYMWIFLILAAAWIFKNFLHPTAVTSFDEFVARSAIGMVPGIAILGVGIVFNAAMFLVGFLTAGLTQATGEVLPKWESNVPILDSMWRAMQEDSETSRAKPVKPVRSRKELLALVISNKPQAIADRVLRELNRGVTALHGKGMYAQQERDVLMIAVTVTEMNTLKAMVKAEDPSAFCIVAPAQEVIGRGFGALA
ncbi:MAG: DUF2270 domain-containing protein [Chloroflexi bacterium]|nr:DUF2270 domain-containing protein [Chloroflexota bacterium]